MKTSRAGRLITEMTALVNNGYWTIQNLLNTVAVRPGFVGSRVSVNRSCSKE